MSYLIICLASFFASALTLFSGFGLGTLLMPVLALFFPINLAIALTAVVHFFNNLFKFVLLGKHAQGGLVKRFGTPAIVGAFLGAWCLTLFSEGTPILQYTLLGIAAKVTLLKVLMALLILIFVALDVRQPFEKESLGFSNKYLTLGGLLSGFFGGLSGHQGAFRSAFLINCGLSKESFVATGVVIACLVDIARLFVYSTRFLPALEEDYLAIACVAVLSAFAGAWMGNALLKKVTIRMIQGFVAVLLSFIAVGLALGII